MLIRRLGVVIASAIVIVVVVVTIFALLLIMQGRQLNAAETNLRHFLQHQLPVHATIAQTHTLLQSRGLQDFAHAHGLQSVEEGLVETTAAHAAYNPTPLLYPNGKVFSAYLNREGGSPALFMTFFFEANGRLGRYTVTPVQHLT